MTEESDSVMVVAGLMALSARTAPKGRGLDSMVQKTAGPGDLPALAAELDRLGKQYGLSFFHRDAGNILSSDACLLLGIRGREPLGINCQGCGYRTCNEMMESACPSDPGASPFRGPNCVIKMADLGIAVGSAAKTAAIHNVDNRVMYSAGVAALSLGWLPGCTVAYGLPLKASGKNIFFDRQ